MSGIQTAEAYGKGLDLMLEDMREMVPASTPELRFEANMFASLTSMTREDLAGLLAVAMERIVTT